MSAMKAKQWAATGGLALVGLAAACGTETAGPVAEVSGASAACDIVTAGTANAPSIVATGRRGAEARLERSQNWLAEYALRPGVSVTENGLYYEVLQSGEADAPSPELGEFVCVHYRGITVDGREFDGSCSGLPAAFQSNRLIAAWQEALPLMREGDIWELAAPPALAYGEAGAAPVIQPNEALVFRMALLRVLDGDFPANRDCSVGE